MIHPRNRPRPGETPGKGNDAAPAAGAIPADGGSVDRSAYPFADRYVDLPAGRMHYVDEGVGGETVLFVHGTPTWSFDWRRLVTALSPRHRCLAPDHLGFGLSERPEGFAYTPEAHADNLDAFVRALGLRDLTLVVHDFGGPIGLPLRMRDPSLVKRIVLINTWMWSFAGDKAMEKSARMAGSALGRFLYRRANFSLRVLTPYAYGDRKKLTPELHRQYLDRFPDAWSRERVLWTLARSLSASGPFYASLWDRRESLKGIPLLILWGMRDRAFPPAMLKRWREAFPEAAAVELPSAGHWPHEEEPAAVEKAIRDFLGG